MKLMKNISKWDYLNLKNRLPIILNQASNI